MWTSPRSRPASAPTFPSSSQAEARSRRGRAITSPRSPPSPPGLRSRGRVSNSRPPAFTVRGTKRGASRPTRCGARPSEPTHGAIVITGTNGKTTTARLIGWLLEGAGHSVVSNRAGANLIFGATAAALDRAGANGRLQADWGVFEIDEASLERAVDEIQPRATIVLNLFRDQLDRYGELETIAKKIESALARLPG